MKNFLLPCLLFICLSYNSFSQAIIDRGPYLQLGTPNSMIIKWRTEDPTESIVWYGTATDNLNGTAQSIGTTTEHEVQLSGLSSNTYYYYAVGDSTGQLMGGDTSFRFRTYPTVGSETPFTAWIQGDPGTGGNVQRATRDGFYTYLGEEEMDLMLVLGDNAYSDGKQSEFQNAFFEDMYENLINKVVVWPTLGNHDGHSADSETESGPYYDIFTLPRNGEAGGVPSGTEAYYSYDYANAHLVVLNSVDVDRSATGAMALWLENDLASNNQDWLIAYFHHPIYSGANDNESDDGNEEVDMRENILPILEAHDIDLVLFGDTHNYQRSFLLKGHYGVSSTFDTLTMAVDYSTGRLADDTPYTKLNQNGGAVFVVAGSAGKLEGEDEANLNHPTTVIGLDEMGSVALDINGSQLDFRFILQDGSVADHFTILKEINPLTVQITNPTNGTFFPGPQNITITADASDIGGGVTQVAFYVNGELIGIDYSAPYAVNWHPLYAGPYTLKAVATDTDDFTQSSIVNVQVGQTTTVCAQVNQSSDDAEERPNGSINLTSGDLELVDDGSNNQVVGMRFTTLNIPRGAAITNAFLDFKVKDDNNTNPCQLSISGQAGNNTITFSTTANDISSRPKTNTSINWSPSDWNNVNDNQSSIDIAEVLQEIVLQDIYTPETPIVIIIEGLGRRTAFSFDGGADNAPRLCVTYDADNCLDSDFDGTCDIDDLCPGGAEPGQACNDNYSGTFNDVITNDCGCQGTLYDCPDLAVQFGSPCNDNYSGTYNDIIINDCTCQGTLYDCPDLAAQFGTPCNDNYSGTYNDIVTNDCICQGTLYDCPDLATQFGTPCNDNNITTFDDLITTDCECAGTPYDCPDLQLQYGTPCNDNNPFTCYDIITTNCDCVGTPTTSFTTITTQINQDNDDAEERSNGSVNTGSSDLEIVEDGSNVQTVGLRFTGSEVAPGTTVSEAYVQFTVDETKNANPSNFIIYGELSTNATTFTTSNNNISTRTKTNASVSWSPNNWTAIDDKGIDQRTPNIAPIIQEIINQSGYSTGSPFVLIIEGEGRRVAVSHDGNSNDAAELNITYGISLDDSDGDGVCDDEDQCFGPEPGNTCDDNNPGTYDDVINNNCQCVGTPFDCPALGLNIGASCNDGNSATFNDYVNSNCQCVGTLFECPALNANIGDACNDGDPLTTNDQVNANCNCAGDPPVEIQICDQVNADSDDAEEQSNGVVNTTSSDLELVEDNDNVQIIGTRFTNLNLQQGAVISQAFLQFTVDKNKNVNPCNLTIHGELSTNAATFEKITDNISNRTLTAANATWSPEDWQNTGDSGSAQQSVDISSIIQEITNQPGFGSNSAIVLIISGEGLRQAISHDEDAQGAPELCLRTLVPASQAMVISSDLAQAQQIHSSYETGAGDLEEDKNGDITAVFPYLKVYPNPAKVAITASFNAIASGQVSVVIMNTNGKTLLTKEIIVERGDSNLLLDTSNLSNGVYFLTLQTEWGRRLAKFSIIK